MTTFRLGHKIDSYLFFTHKSHYIQTLLIALFFVDMESGVSVSF